MSFISVKEAVNGAFQGMLKGEIQEAIGETIQGANKEATQTLLSGQNQQALNVPPYKYQLEHFQGHLKEHFKGIFMEHFRKYLKSAL